MVGGLVVVVVGVGAEVVVLGPGVGAEVVVVGPGVGAAVVVVGPGVGAAVVGPGVGADVVVGVAGLDASGDSYVDHPSKLYLCFLGYILHTFMKPYPPPMVSAST